MNTDTPETQIDVKETKLTWTPPVLRTDEADEGGKVDNTVEVTVTVTDFGPPS